ncbi:MAG: sigma-70 family RNA polymerase sigma factor [Pseudomonadota bacterium]
MNASATDIASANLVSSMLQQHAGRLRAFVSARVPASDVDDVLQSAAMRAVEHASSLQDPARVMPWLYRLHRNLIADMFRQQASYQRKLEATTAETEQNEPVIEICDCSVAQAKRLHTNYAAILSAVDFGNATVAEAASELGISVNNATVRLHRARKALRQAMFEHCGVKSMRECLDCRCVSEGCCST